MTKSKILKQLQQYIISTNERVEVSLLNPYSFEEQFYSNASTLEDTSLGLTLCSGLPNEDNFIKIENLPSHQLEHWLQEYKIAFKNQILSDKHTKFNASTIINKILSQQEIEVINSLDRDFLQLESNDFVSLEELSFWSLITNLENIIDKPEDFNYSKQTITSLEKITKKLHTLKEYNLKYNRELVLSTFFETKEFTLDTLEGKTNLVAIKPNFEVLQRYMFGNPLYLKFHFEDALEPLSKTTSIIVQQDLWTKGLDNWINSISNNENEIDFSAKYAMYGFVTFEKDVLSLFSSDRTGNLAVDLSESDLNNYKETTKKIKEWYGIPLTRQKNFSQ